jgi:hypothetical protein
VKRKEEMRTFVHSFLMTVDYRRSKKKLDFMIGKKGMRREMEKKSLILCVHFSLI